MLPNNQEPNKVWYKTTGGAIFLGFVGLILTGFVIFGLLIVSYLWQIKYGDAEKLAKTFESGFSLNPLHQSANFTSELPIDHKTLKKSYSPVLGNPDAKITITAFIDFECPYCQASYPIFKEMVEVYGPAIQVVFKHLPVNAIHPRAQNAHLAAACAHEQNKFWQYYDQIFTNNNLKESALTKYAETIDLNMNQFANCYESQKYQSNIESDVLEANTIGVRGTPTYTINQLKLEGVVEKKVWDQIIINQLQNN